MQVILPSHLNILPVLPVFVITVPLNINSYTHMSVQLCKQYLKFMKNIKQTQITKKNIRM